MVNSNDSTQKFRRPPVPATKAATPAVDQAKAAVSGPGADSLKSHMPAGELGVRNPPGEVLSTASGGTSKAEDTTRTAGYVADLTKANEPPPGPPIAKEPSNFAGPESTTVAPVRNERKPMAQNARPPLPDPTDVELGAPNKSRPTPLPTQSRVPVPPTPANPAAKPDRGPPKPAEPVTIPAQVKSP